MSLEEMRDKQLAEWLIQNAKRIQAERQRQERVEEEKIPSYGFIPFEDIRTSLEARENEETLERTINQFDAKCNAYMQLAQQKLLGEAIIRMLQ